MEEGDEGVVGRLDEEQLQRVSVKGDAFEGSNDSMQKSASSDVTDTVNIVVGEHCVFMVVGESTGGVNE